MRIPRRIRIVPLLCLALLAAACVTVNIYFPAAQVERAAEQIVEEVYGSAPGAKPESNATRPTSGLEQFLAWLGPREALARDALTVSNASIRGLKSQLAANHQQLAPFYARGAVGVANTGDVALLSVEGLPVPEAGRLKQLVARDNDLRRQLYQEVAQALQLPSSEVGKVQGVFALQWRQQAQPGWRVQGDNGSWSLK